MMIRCAQHFLQRSLYAHARQAIYRIVEDILVANPDNNCFLATCHIYTKY